MRQLFLTQQSDIRQLVNKEIEIDLKIHTLYVAPSKKLFIKFGEERSDTYGVIELDSMQMIEWFGYDPADPEVKYYLANQNKKLSIKASWERETHNALEIMQDIKIRGKIDDPSGDRLKVRDPIRIDS